MTPEEYRKQLAKKKRLLRTIYNSFPVAIKVELAIKQHNEICKIAHATTLRSVECMIDHLHIFCSEWMTKS